MRDYQCMNTKYILPRAVYYQTIWRIRDYYRMKKKAEEMIVESPSELDGMPKGKNISDPTIAAVERRERLLKDIGILEEELTKLPGEYRAGVWNNILFGEAYPDYASRSTFGLYKSRYIHAVAVRHGYHD